MIAALRTRPADFAIDGSWLHHVPSHHRFNIDPDGNVGIDAHCDCAILHVQRAQGRELWNAYQTWLSAYWRPMEINKEFAGHFRPPNIWQRICRRLIIRIPRAMRPESTVSHGSEHWRSLCSNSEAGR